VDARVVTLVSRGIDATQAAALVTTGFDTPRKIRAAKDADLEKITGVGSSGLAALRARWPTGREE
jgi:Fe-S cluster assembly scaffold protein SufB